MDEANIKTAMHWFSLGAKRGAIILAQAIENQDIEVHQDSDGVYFILNTDSLSARRKLRIKSGDKTIEKSKMIRVRLDEVFPHDRD